MLRNDPGLEFIGFLVAIASIVAAFVILPSPWYVSAPVAVLTGYAVLETLLPEVWDADDQYDSEE
jgi:hypothetical protein